MFITYENKKLEKILKTEALIQKQYGRFSKILMIRLGQLAFADNLEEFRAMGGGRLHELKGDYTGNFSVRLTANWRLVFQPVETINLQEPILNEQNTYILQNIKTIKIISIEDYHENDG